MEEGKHVQHSLPLEGFGAIFVLLWLHCAEDSDQITFNASGRFIGDFNALHEQRLRENLTGHAGEPHSKVMVDFL